MRYIIALILSLAFYQPAPAQQPGNAIIGPGCTTFAYIDKACKPCGVGYKSSASYPVTTNPPAQGVNAFYTLGDTPDAEPNDAAVCTTAQWATKWGCATSACNQTVDNTAMVNYLNQHFQYGNGQVGFTNTGKIYYISLTGDVCNPSCTTAAVNDPAHPYGRWSTIATALSTVTANFTGTVTLVSGSPVITISGSCTGTLARGSLLTVAAGVPVNDYIRQQVTNTGGAGCIGTYLATQNSTSSVTEAVHAGIQPGGVVVIRGGTWSGCTSASPVSPCLSFQAQSANGGNPNWYPSASPSGWLLITSFPGESVQIMSGSNSGDVFDFGLSGNGIMHRAACCVIINGLAMSDPKFGNGQQGAIFSNYTTDLIIQNNEFAGWDKIVFNNGSNRVLVINNVFHEMYSHAVYEGWNTGCALTNPGVDTDYSKDLSVNILQNGCGASFNYTVAYNVIYDSGKQNSDILHSFGWNFGGVETDNIISYSGYPFSISLGSYNNTATGNLLFDNSSQCYLGSTSSNFYGLATFSAGVTSFPITTMNIGGTGQNFGINGYYIFGVGIYGEGTPQAVVPNGTKIVTGSGSSGTYTVSNPTTAAVSTSPVISGGNNGASNSPGASTERWNTFSNNICWMGNPADQIFGGSPGMGIRVYEITGLSYHKNDVFNNNVIVTYDNSTGGSLPIEFQVASAETGLYAQPLNAGVFPETDRITGNSFYNIGTFACSVAGANCNIASADAGSSATAPWLAGGTFNPTTFAAQFPGNTYLGSLTSNPGNNPLPGAIEANAQSPWLFTFPRQYMVQ